MIKVYNIVNMRYNKYIRVKKINNYRVSRFSYLYRIIILKYISLEEFIDQNKIINMASDVFLNRILCYIFKELEKVLLSIYEYYLVY